MPSSGRKLIGLRATPLLAESPIRLANWLGYSHCFRYFITKPTVATHLATKKDKRHLLVHAPSVISLHYQRSRSPILFLYLRILCFTHHLPIFRAYLSPFNQCHSHHTQSKRLSSPVGTIHPTFKPFPLWQNSSKPLQTEKDWYLRPVLRTFLSSWKHCYPTNHF